MNLMLWIASLVFSLTVARNGDHISLQYPVDDKVQWVEVCVESEGRYDPVDPRRAEHWYNKSCWAPRFKIEEYKLKDGAIHVRAHLEISENGNHVTLHTPTMQVRPESEM
jgi:hypothetical protein